MPTTTNTITIPTQPETGRAAELHHFRSDAILIIEGADRSGGPGGWGVGGWGAKGEGRTEYRGLVKGAHAYAYGLCSVIDNVGGTGRTHRAAEEAGLLFRVKAGDVLEIDGVAYRLELRRGYPDLIAV